MNPVVVYSQPQCVQCDATKRFLETRNIPFTEIRVDQDPEALEYVKSLGYSQAPVVVAGDKHWSGFRFEQLTELASRN